MYGNTFPWALTKFAKILEKAKCRCNSEAPTQASRGRCVPVNFPAEASQTTRSGELSSAEPPTEKVASRPLAAFEICEIRSCRKSIGKYAAEALTAGCWIWAERIAPKTPAVIRAESREPHSSLQLASWLTERKHSLKVTPQHLCCSALAFPESVRKTCLNNCNGVAGHAGLEQLLCALHQPG